MNADDMRDFALYSGHLTGSFSEFLGRRLRTVTILRDPVQRSISHYAHVRRDSGSLYHKVAKGLSLREFCLHPETRHLIDNYQTRFLAGGPLAAPRPWPREIALPDSEATGGDMLARARAVLHDCIAVGVTEQLPDTLSLFADILGLRWSGVTPYENASYNRPQAVDPEDLALIRDLTAFDSQLYQEAVEMLAAQKANREHRLFSGAAAPTLVDGRVAAARHEGRSIAARLALPEQAHRFKLRLSRTLYRAPRPVRVAVVALYRNWIALVSWWRGPHGRLLSRWFRRAQRRLGQGSLPRPGQANLMPAHSHCAGRETVEAARK